LIQTCEGRPHYIEASSRVPGPEMPGKGNEDEDEAEKGKDREKWVEDVRHGRWSDRDRLSGRGTCNARCPCAILAVETSEEQ
jgi:hypothetical protein